MRIFLLAALLAAAAAPALAWEARASKVSARLAAPRSPARYWRKPGWAKNISSADERASWTEEFGGRTYVFGVGLVRGVQNAGLRLTAAEDRARAALLEVRTSEDLKGAEILDWHLDRRGNMYALAVLIK